MRESRRSKLRLTNKQPRPSAPKAVPEVQGSIATEPVINAPNGSTFAQCIPETDCAAENGAAELCEGPKAMHAALTEVRDNGHTETTDNQPANAKPVSEPVLPQKRMSDVAIDKLEGPADLGGQEGDVREAPSVRKSARPRRQSHSNTFVEPDIDDDSEGGRGGSDYKASDESSKESDKDSDFDLDEEEDWAPRKSKKKSANQKKSIPKPSRKTVKSTKAAGGSKSGKRESRKTAASTKAPVPKSVDANSGGNATGGQENKALPHTPQSTSKASLKANTPPSGRKGARQSTADRVRKSVSFNVAQDSALPDVIDVKQPPPLPASGRTSAGSTTTPHVTPTPRNPGRDSITSRSCGREEVSTQKFRVGLRPPGTKGPANGRMGLLNGGSHFGGGTFRIPGLRRPKPRRVRDNPPT